ncbi:MAG: hypothetical protein IPG04_16020 [Polyangiaceae bacterium]|nr:hypothetical protein [Polyangiaceae bacterium]
MNSTASVHAVSRRPELRLFGATEGRRAFHDRVLDGIRKFLEDHAMAGKTGAREFYEFEKRCTSVCERRSGRSWAT